MCGVKGERGEGQGVRGTLTDRLVPSETDGVSGSGLREADEHTAGGLDSPQNEAFNLRILTFYSKILSKNFFF